MWVINRNDPYFMNNYHKVDGEKKSNVRGTTVHLAEHWRAFNCVMVNNGHLGNIVWRVKLTNTLNNTIDFIEVWRSKEIVESIFGFKDSDTFTIEQATTHNTYVSPASPHIDSGGTGLINGSGLTINDPNAPRVYTKDNKRLLAEGLWESGFDMRLWDGYPMISKQQAIDVFNRLKEMSLSTQDIKINTGYNPTLNSL